MSTIAGRLKYSASLSSDIKTWIEEKTGTTNTPVKRAAINSLKLRHYTSSTSMRTSSFSQYCLDSR
jgi:hypothetical protein